MSAVEALIGLGEAQRQTGDSAYRETLLEASQIASVLRDAELAARAAQANSRGWFSMIGGIDEERIDAIERALQLDDPPVAARRASLLALEALERHYDQDFGRRKALADEALALARNTGDARTLAEALFRASYAYWTAETLEQRAAFLDGFAECAETVGDPVLDYWAHYLAFIIQIEAGELERARDALERTQLAAEELGQPALKWAALFTNAAWHLMHGDLAAGERLVELAFQAGREAGEPDAIVMYGVQLNLLRLVQGRGEELLPVLERTVDASAIAGWKAALPQLMAWTGRGAEARAILERGVSARFAEVPWQQSRSTALAFYADAAVLTGDRAAASILYELIEPWAGQTIWNGAAGYGHARMYLGLLAAVLERHEEADEHLQFACEFHETNGLFLWAARAHLGWAEALAARGDNESAREHAIRALELSREHGFGAFEPRAAALVETESAAGT